MKIVFSRKDVEQIVLNHANSMLGEGMPAFNEVNINTYGSDFVSVETVEINEPTEVAK